MITRTYAVDNDTTSVHKNNEITMLHALPWFQIKLRSQLVIITQYQTNPTAID